MAKFGDEAPYLGNKGYFPHRYPHAAYAGMISYLDEQVGLMVQQLKELGIYDNTLIIFTSDNGPTYNGGPIPPGSTAEGHSTVNMDGVKGLPSKGGCGYP